MNDAGYDAYIKYLALKKHFTTDQYDYFKYNGKVRASMDTFRTRNDAYFFTKLSSKENWVEILIANMVHDQTSWIREIIDTEGETRYLEWKKKIDSLTEVFKTDLKFLNEDWEENFVVPDGQHPLILRLYIEKKITLESFTILIHIANIFEYWDHKILDKIISCDRKRKEKKYKPFLAYDEKKFKTIVRNYFF